MKEIKAAHLQPGDIVIGSGFTVTWVSPYTNGGRVELTGFYPHAKEHKYFWNANTTVRVERENG